MLQGRFKLSLIIASALLLVISLCIFFGSSTVNQSSQPKSPCPEGSDLVTYRNGEPLCKIRPTGCPYGDSIPMDACIDPQTSMSHNIEEVEYASFQGK